METTGEATWAHSVRALKPGGTIVISGATTGDAPPAELTRIFFLQLSVIGSTMGTREELERLIRLCVDQGVRPVIHATLPLRRAREGFEEMLQGETSGKIVFTSAIHKHRLSQFAEVRLGQIRSRTVMIDAPPPPSSAPPVTGRLFRRSPGRDSLKRQ